MKLGFDMDGVLARFEVGFVPLLVRVTGHDLFPTGWQTDPTFPPVWDYPQAAGYTTAEVSAAWQALEADPNFWFHLPPTENVPSVARFLHERGRFADAYFLTKRMGLYAKLQTEAWIVEYLEVVPTVLLTDRKGPVCAALGLDWYIDDKPKNYQDVCRESPRTQTYLLKRSYNHTALPPGHPAHVETVQEALASL